MVLKAMKNSLKNNCQEKRFLSKKNLSKIFSKVLKLRNCKMLFASFLVPKLVLVWGTVVRGLRVEIFVRVLRSSRVNLNNVTNTNVFCCV